MQLTASTAPQRTATALKAAVTEAEEELKIRILQLVVGLPRYYVTQVAGSAGMKRSNPDSCITREEINNLKSMAIDSYTLDDEVKDEIYGAVAQSFSADTDITGASESDIIGVPGETLEGNFKIFIGAKRPVRNIDVMLNEMGVALARKVFSPNAAAQAVLTEAEKENGVALVEIGAGVTSVTIYRGRLLRHYSSIPFGGRSITNDIKSECGFTEALAENIKLAFGACLPDKLQNLSDKIIQINDNENGSYEQLSVKYLSQIITCRVREILEAVLYQIQQSGYADQLRNGVVITGGGAMLVNMCQMLKEMSGYTVRIGYPRTQVFSSGGCPGATEPSASASAPESTGTCWTMCRCSWTCAMPTACTWLTILPTTTTASRLPLVFPRNGRMASSVSPLSAPRTVTAAIRTMPMSSCGPSPSSSNTASNLRFCA